MELTALPGRIEVAWSAPKSDGGSAVTSYIATASPGGATCTTTGATLCTITGLDDGTAYRVAVAAITRRPHGYVVAMVEGTVKPTINGSPLGTEGVDLHHGDLLELAGTQMQFVQQ